MSGAIEVLMSAGAVVLDPEGTRNSEDDEPGAVIVLGIVQRDMIRARIEQLEAALPELVLAAKAVLGGHNESQRTDLIRLRNAVCAVEGDPPLYPRAALNHQQSTPEKT